MLSSLREVYEQAEQPVLLVEVALVTMQVRDDAARVAERREERVMSFRFMELQVELQGTNCCTEARVESRPTRAQDAPPSRPASGRSLGPNQGVVRSVGMWWGAEVRPRSAWRTRATGTSRRSASCSGSR